jgi:hypothetical protein
MTSNKPVEVPDEQWSEPCWRVLEQIARGEGDSTPWDEPRRDWGSRRDDPLLSVRKAFNRELRLGTW